jgi:hypothetical protein
MMVELDILATYPAPWDLGRSFPEGPFRCPEFANYDSVCAPTKDASIVIAYDKKKM